MRAPFEIAAPASTIAEYVIRIENALHDRNYLHDEEMYFVVDNYILFCLFLKDSYNLESFCANRIYRDDNLRFVVLPESLWELRRNITDTAKSFNEKKRKQSWRSFFEEPQVKQFLSLMEDGDRVKHWREIIKLLGKMMADERQRSFILSVLEFGRIRDFAGPLANLADDVSRGKVCTLMRLAQAFGVAAIQGQEEDWHGAYRLLNRFRSRHHSDVVDSLVYAKVKNLNTIANGASNGHVCRFFSHESMIDMLEQSIPQVNRRYVRSLTDSLLLLSEETIGAGETEEILAKLMRARSGVRAAGADPGELLIEDYQVTGELSKIRDRLLDGHGFNQFSKNQRSGDLHSLLSVEAERFARNLRELDRGKSSIDRFVADRADECQAQIESLYRAINNFRDAQETLEEFMKPVEAAAQKLRESIEGDQSYRSDMEDLVIQLLTAAKPDDDILILLNDAQEYDLDPKRLIGRIRQKVMPESDVKLWPKLGELVNELERMPPRRRGGPKVPAWQHELRALVEQLPAGGLPVLDQIEDLVEKHGEEARRLCQDLIESAMAGQEASDIYTQALLRIARVSES